MKKLSVLIIDDHPAMAFGTKSIVEEDGRFKVCDVAHSGEQGIKYARKYKPDMILLDYQLPDMTGREVIQHIRGTQPQVPIIVFTGFDYSLFMNRLIEVGVNGLISKSADPKQVIRMMDCVLQGDTVIPQFIFRRMRYFDDNKSIPENIDLTENEIQLMSKLASGMKYTEMAEELFVTQRVLEHKLRKIYEKLGAKTKSEALVRFEKIKEL